MDPNNKEQQSTALPAIPECERLKKPKLERVILLDKLTRWEVLCEKAKSDAEIELMKKQFPGMFETYRTHIVTVQYIIDTLRDHQVRLDVVKAQRNKPVSLRNVDAIISAGGDGTFLEAASLIGWTPLPCPLSAAAIYKRKSIDQGVTNTLDGIEKSGGGNGCQVSWSTPCIVPPIDSTTAQHPVWVFGINTDPSRSEGKLLLQSPCTEGLEEHPPKETTHSLGMASEPTIAELRCRFRPGKQKGEGGTKLSEASMACMNHSIGKILNGLFRPIRRRRIRVTIFDPLATERLSGPPGSMRREETITRREEEGRPESSKSSKKLNEASKESTRSSPSIVVQHSSGSLDGVEEDSDMSIPHPKKLRSASTQYFGKPQNALELFGRKHRTIEYRAVNDVLVTSKESHMSTYIEMIVDGGPPQRSKNSGVIVCTGSGSSAWAYNVSKVPEDTISKIVENFISCQSEDVKKNLVVPPTKALSHSVNSSLLFNPEDSKMRFVVRDPIDNRVFSTHFTSGFCQHIAFRPLNAEVCLSLDGLSVVPVTFGQTVVLEIQHHEDVLLTGN